MAIKKGGIKKSVKYGGTKKGGKGKDKGTRIPKRK